MSTKAESEAHLRHIDVRVKDNVETMWSLSKGIKATEFPNIIYWTESVNLVNQISKASFLHSHELAAGILLSTVLMSILEFPPSMDTL